MSYVGQYEVVITKDEQRKYQGILERLEHVMGKYENNNEIISLLEYIKNGSRHRAMKRPPMRNTKHLLDRVERSKHA